MIYNINGLDRINKTELMAQKYLSELFTSLDLFFVSIATFTMPKWTKDFVVVVDRKILHHYIYSFILSRNIEEQKSCAASFFATVMFGLLPVGLRSDFL